MTAKIFDINQLVLNAEQMRAMEAPRKRKGSKAAAKNIPEPYARVTAHWQIAADKADAAQVAVALRCIQGMEKARGNHGAFKVPNSRMAEWGVTKWRKMRGLRRLAEAGLILLDETRKNPRVAIVEIGADQ
jgi:hypothetical protein